MVLFQHMCDTLAVLRDLNSIRCPAQVRIEPVSPLRETKPEFGQLSRFLKLGQTPSGHRSNRNF